jgi:diguanylate cyclase (GGDEF)-like protein
MPKKTPNIPLGEYRIPRRKLKPIKSPTGLVKGIKKLVHIRRQLQKREEQELKQLVEAGAPKNVIQQKIARMRSLRKKAQYVIDYREMQKTDFVTHDAEFPKLLNRTFFFDRVQLSLANKGQHTLVYLDMDKLKQLNNLLGRKEGGMNLLQAYEKALSKTVKRKKGALAGHIGGDEFVVYLPMSAKEARSFMGNIFGSIRKVELKKLRKHPKLVGHNNRVSKNPKSRRRLTFSYSAGIIEVPRRADIDQVEHAGDLLCKMAKRQSRERPTFSTRNDLAKFERELAKKGTKL